MFGATNDWGSLEHLVADLIDVSLMHAWVTAGSKKNPKPDPVPRPGSAARDTNRRITLPGPEIERRLLDQQRRRKERA